MRFTMIRAAMVVAAALCFTCLSNRANAGFVNGTVYLNPGYGSNPYDTSYASYNADGSASLDVDETWMNSDGNTYSFDVTGQTDSDPPLHIIKDVTNSTGSTWVGYHMSLDPADPHTFELFSPAPTSDHFALGAATPTTLTFGAGSVAAGQTVEFNFVVNVNFGPGTFHFTLTQMPIIQQGIPEPATAVSLLLALCCGVISIRRRQR